MRIPSITKSPLLLLLIFLSACATPSSERSYVSTKNSILISNDKFHACLKNITKKEEYKNLLNKIVATQFHTENSKQKPESTISKEDTILLRAFSEEHKSCDIKKLNDYKIIDNNLYALGNQQLKTRETYFSDWLNNPEITYRRISEDFEYLIKRENQQNASWVENYTEGMKRQQTIEAEDRARFAEELSAGIESTAEAFIDALIFLGTVQSTTSTDQQSSALQTTGSQCPTGSHPWTDQWGNSICKDSITGTTTTISGTIESCPPGTFRWVDSFGTPICKSSTSSEEYYDTSKGCPVGTFQSINEWGNPSCKKF
jgi:hypothetical protein